MERQEPVLLVSNDEWVQDVPSGEAASLLWWRGPLLLALAGHGLLLLLLSQQSWQRPPEPVAPVTAIDAYFYQAPAKVEPESVVPNQEPFLEEELVADAEELMAEPEAVSKEAVLLDTDTDPAAEADAEATADDGKSEEGPAIESAALPSGVNQRGRLMDRALRHVQPTEELASAHRAQQLQRHAKPKITVEKRYQETHDGSKPIRNSRGCLSGDPSVDGFGFDGLMAAKYVPCGDEISAGQQLQEILQRRSRHSGRSN